MRIPFRARAVARLQQLSSQSSVIGKTPEQIPALRARLAIEPNRFTRLVAGEPAPNVVIDDHYAEFDGRRLRLRRYRPPASGPHPTPVIVDFHGGGYVIGQPELKDWYNSELARRTGALVVSVDYRLAPEYRFPAAYFDAVGAYCWIARTAPEWNCDPERIAVTGDSAGASLAAGVALAMSRLDEVPAPRAQVLLYPATDLVTRYPSDLENATAPFLSVAESEAYLALYCAPEDLADPRVSPLLARDFIGVAPAVIITAEHDPLRDQGIAYGEALAAAGVYARGTTYPGTAHGFMSTPGLYPAAIHALREIVDELADLLAPEDHCVATTGDPATRTTGEAQ